jgi:hypothetical protein
MVESIGNKATFTVKYFDLDEGKSYAQIETLMEEAKYQ